jgi:excisionase family DNA binding protein
VIETPPRKAALQPSIDDLLKPSQVARLLGVSRSWLYQAAKDGRVPSLRLGGSDGPLRFVEADLREWLERARDAWQPGDTTRETLDRVVERRAA